MHEHGIDEFLEEVWMYFEEKNKPVGILNGKDRPVKEYKKILPGAEQQGFIVRKDDEIELTQKGLTRSRNIVRRHRLAERLFHDVFDLHAGEVERSACEFEHVLNSEATDSICILLGHPRTCPHGKVIPSGECCLNRVEDIRPLVVRIDRLNVGETGTIAYLGTHNESRLNRLSNLGIVPGNGIKLVQRYPSLVVKIDETTLAIDKEVAGDIFVKRPRYVGRAGQQRRRGWQKN